MTHVSVHRQPRTTLNIDDVLCAEAVKLTGISVWVDHLRAKNDSLGKLLEQGQVSIHSMIIGELACGNLRNRKPLLGFLQNLPHAIEASHDEVFRYLENNKLMGKGIGFIDLHLLASTLLSPNTLLWTLDRRLGSLADALGSHWVHS